MVLLPSFFRDSRSSSLGRCEVSVSVGGTNRREAGKRRRRIKRRKEPGNLQIVELPCTAEAVICKPQLFVLTGGRENIHH